MHFGAAPKHFALSRKLYRKYSFIIRSPGEKERRPHTYVVQYLSRGFAFYILPLFIYQFWIFLLEIYFSIILKDLYCPVLILLSYHCVN